MQVQMVISFFIHYFLPMILQDLKKYGATTVVRVCEVTYDKTPLEKDGITVVVSDVVLSVKKYVKKKCSICFALFCDLILIGQSPHPV